MSEPTIPPSTGPDQARLPARTPTRAEIETSATLLVAGGRRKADLRALDVDGVPVVVKDFSRKSAPRRWLGRLQVSRELKAYRQAGPLEELPRLIGRVDRYALALERIEGVRLGKSETRFAEAERHLRRLRRFLEKLHDRGIAHLDLRGKGNVLLERDGRLRVVDLGAAIRVKPGGLLHRFLFPLLTLSDRTGLLKWKARLAPDLLTADEEAFLLRYRFVRRLWVLNRQHVRPAAAKPGGSGIASRLPRNGEDDDRDREGVVGN